MKRYVFIILLLSAPASSLAEKQRLDISGRLLLDADYFDEFFDKDGEDASTKAEVRNARVQLEWDLPKKWEARLQIEVEDDELELGSTYFRYKGWDPADITLGKLKEPLGMERNHSRARLMMIERSMMSRAFTQQKTWGLHMFHANDHWRWALALAVDADEDDEEDYDEDEPYALTGRLTHTLFNEGGHFLQLGMAGSQREWNENIYQVRESAEVNTADNVLRSARFRAEQQSTGALEAMWNLDSLMLQAEYMLTEVEEIDGTDWNYDGYYLAASYFLTGETHRIRKGELRRVKPIAEAGAWELAARYSDLDVRDNGIGSESTVSRVGVNYYYKRDLRLMLNLLYADVSGDTRHTETDGFAASVRFQYLFR